MIRLMRSLYKYGLRLGSITRSRLKQYHTFEITNPDPVFTLCETPTTIPKFVGRSRNDLPNRLFDNGKFFFQITKIEFWPRFLADLDQLQNSELCKAAAKAKETMLGWHVQRLTSNGEFIRLHRLAKGQKPPADLNLEKIDPKAVPSGALNTAAWLVPLYKGQPIITMPTAVSWWEQEFLQAIYDPIPGEQPDIDILTGETCVPNRLHRMIDGFAGTEGKAALVSYNEPSYEYFAQKQGVNFPMAAMTIYTYSEALTYLLDKEQGNCGVHVTDKLTLVMWPTQEGLTHPIIGPACAVLGKWLNPDKAAPFWEQIEAINPDDTTVLDVALFLGGRGKGRVALLNHSSIQAGVLRKNLLRFRTEMRGFASFKALASVNLGGGSAPLLFKKHIPDVVWALIFGLPIYDGVVRDLLRPRADPDNSSAPLIDRCTAVWLSLHHNRKAGYDPMSNDSNDDNLILSPPDIEVCTRNLPRTRAAFFGRLLYCFIAMKRVKHGYYNEKTVKSHQTFKNGMRSPGMWLASSATTKFQIYASYARDTGKRSDRVFEAHWLEVLGELGDWGPHQPTSDEKHDIALGWYAEKDFADQHFDQHSVRKPANKADKNKNKTGSGESDPDTGK